MKINSDKNRAYYESDQSVPCDCEGCYNYVVNIGNEYPLILQYLANMNVDIFRPFELIYIEDSRNIEYIACQYIVFGECEEDFEYEIDGVKFEKSKSHPDTNIVEPHFVLEFGPINLKYNIYKKANVKLKNYEEFAGKLISIKTSRILGRTILKFRSEEKTIKVYLGEQAALQLDIEGMYEVGHCGRNVVNIKPMALSKRPKSENAEPVTN